MIHAAVNTLEHANNDINRQNVTNQDVYGDDHSRLAYRLAEREMAKKRRSMYNSCGVAHQSKSQATTFPSLNSGFLAGLFDDVTKITVLADFQLDTTGSTTQEDNSSLGTRVRVSDPNYCSRKEDYSSVSPDDLPYFPLLDTMRTVSPSAYSSYTSSSLRGLPVDESQLWTRVSPTRNHERPSKKCRLSSINVPSLNECHLHRMDRVSYWNLTERSSTLRLQSQDIFSSSASAGSDSLVVSKDVPSTLGLMDSYAAIVAASAQKSLPRDTSMNRLFSQVSFLEIPNVHSNLATVAVDTFPSGAAAHAASAALNRESLPRIPRLTKSSTLNKFPPLPYTISASSCEFRFKTDLDVEAPETHIRNDGACDESSSFGWFVDTDEGNDDDDDHGMITETGGRTLMTSLQNGDMAFQAPAAPRGRRSNHAAIEWAQAADTVDSVLGDIF